LILLRYDKRGVTGNYTIINSNVWGNNTANDQIQNGKKALKVLIQQPEVDSKRITIHGHSEGTLYPPRIAIDNSTKVKNVILVSTLAQNASVSEYNTNITIPKVLYTSIG
jgi:hypothetical protein